MRQLDSRLVAAALAAIVAVLVLLRCLVYPSADINWTYQVAMLCLVVAVGVGYALRADRRASPAADEGTRWPERLLLPTILLVAVLPYLPSLTFGFFSDDFSFTAVVGRLHSPIEAFTTRVFQLLYRPLHISAWWLEHRLWGDAPLGYHAVSIALHGLNAVLVYLLAKRLTGKRTMALLAGLLFGLHPLHTETVVWPACQVDLQATFLALLSLLCLDFYLSEARPRRRAVAFAGACAFFVLAALTKESAIALPGVAVLWVVYRLGRRGWRPALVVTGVYALLLVGYLVVRLAVLTEFGGYYTANSLWNTWFPSVPLRQMQLSFFPINEELCISLGRWWKVLVPAMAVPMGAFLLVCSRRAAAVPWQRLAFYGGYTTLLAVPVWQLGNTSPGLEGTRFVYLPTVAMVWLMADVLTIPRQAARSRRVLPPLVVAVTAVLCIWYLAPWHTAQGLVNRVLSAAVAMVKATPTRGREPLFFVRDLPDTTAGAQVFRNGFPQAVKGVLGEDVLVQTISPRSGIPEETLALSTLKPGEYLYAWQYKSKELKLERSGDTEAQRGRK